MAYRKHRRRKSKRLKKPIKILFFLIFFLGVGFAFYFGYQLHNPYVSILDTEKSGSNIYYSSVSKLFYTEGQKPVANAILSISEDGDDYRKIRTDENGMLYTGWFETENGRYYYDEQGNLVTKSTTIDGQYYELDTDGRVLDNEWKDGKWYMDGSCIGAEHDTLLFLAGETGFYYLSSENGGAPLTNSSTTLKDGRTVRFDENGHLINYQIHDESGYYYPIVEAFETTDITKDVPVDLYQREHASSSSYRFINHRGYHESAPENNMLAFEASYENGYSYVETDVQFTADGIPVLSHDSTINACGRNSDGSNIEESISVDSLSYDQLLQYDFGISRGYQYAGTSITTFEEFIAWCSAKEIKPYIELKDTVDTDDEIQRLVDIVNQYHMENNVTWISFSERRLRILANHATNTRIGFLTTSKTDVYNAMQVMSDLRNQGNDVFIDAEVSSQYNFLYNCQASSIPLELWTINSIDTVNSIDPYVSGVTTDTIIPE